MPTVPMPSGRPMNNNSEDGTQSFNSQLSEENTIRSRSASFAQSANSFQPNSSQPNSFQHPTSSQASYRINSNRTSSFGPTNNDAQAKNFLQTYVRPIVRPIVKLAKVVSKVYALFIHFQSLNIPSVLLSISVTYLAMHLTATPKSSAVEKAEPEFDSGVRLDPSNAQFILFYQTKVDNEIKKNSTRASSAEGCL